MPGDQLRSHEQVGNLATGLLALLLAALSPVYYTMEQAPPLLKVLGYVCDFAACDAHRRFRTG